MAETSTPKVWDFVDEMAEDLKTYLMEHDDPRWGDTWLHRPRRGQEDRIQARFNDYFDQYHNAGVPLPLLSILGNTYIAWIRVHHPELFPE